MRQLAWPMILAALTLSTAVRTTAAPLRLSLDEAVTRALASNPDLNANRKDRDVAAAGVQRSKAWFPANPYLAGGAQRTSQGGVGPNYTFLLSQEFEIGGQRRTRIEAATEGLQKASLDIEHAEHNLAAAVKTAFIQALLSHDRVTLARQGVNVVVELGTQLQRRRSSDTQRMDSNVARIQEARGRREVAAAEQTRETALGTLRRLLMLPIDQEIDLAGTPRFELRELPAGPDLIERALRLRADLAALRHSVQRADVQIALATREAIPNITVSGTVSRFESDTLAGGDIAVPIPIFHRKAGDVAEATAERERARLLLENLERTVAQEALDARRACVTAAADLQAYRDDIVPKSEENLRLEQRLYERGEVTVSELIGIQIDLLTARREHLDAVQTHNEALIELERVIGGPLAPQ